jgi:hypothetical protein
VPGELALIPGGSMTTNAQQLPINSPTRPVLSQTDLVQNLVALNQIAETLNQAVDMRSVLNAALARLVELMGLETGWIFLNRILNPKHDRS